MLKNANIECNTVTVLHCMKYAINVLKYADNMHLHERNMQKYANNMQTLCITYANIETVFVKYAKKNAVKICIIILFYMKNMQKSIYAIYCIYMHSPLC